MRMVQGLVAFICGMMLSLFAACGSGGTATDAGTDAQKDAGGDSAGDQNPSCGSLTAQEAGLVRIVFVAGASDSPGCGNDPCTLADIQASSSYHSLVVSRAWDRVQGCVGYSPVEWVTGYPSVGNAPADTTLSLVVDAFYHYSGADLAAFKSEVQGYLSAFHAAAPNAPLFVCNIPAPMIINRTDPAAFNAAIADAVGQYPAYHLLDLDALYTKLQAGKVTYNGTVLSPTDILMDPVHLNTLGHRLVAEMFLQRINGIYPDLQLPPYGTLIIN